MTSPLAPLRPHPLGELRHDLPASVVVALVALPLCLGIALASGAPLMAGLLTGVVGGVVVAWLSGAPLAVSGPAAGLTVIVASAIAELGSYEAFLLSVVFAGVLQILFGYLRFGIFGYYIPSAVIRGMLAAIGILLVLNQIPNVLGYHRDFLGGLSLFEGASTWTEVERALQHIEPGALIVALAALAYLLLAGQVPLLGRVKALPPPLVAVLLGVGIDTFLSYQVPEWALGAKDLLVDIPLVDGIGGLRVATPDFGRIADPAVYKAALVIAAVASIETLLCTEAIDKLDPFKRVTPPNRELRAQGVGNLVAGLLGGLPMTAVIVRGSANVTSGGRTRMSAFLHGVWLLLAVLLLAQVLNLIPLAALAAVLIDVGYKLSPIRLFRQMYRLGRAQFWPFVATVAAVLATDLLLGVLIGLGVAVFYLLKESAANPYDLERTDEASTDGKARVRLVLGEHLTFLDKAAVTQALHALQPGSVVEVDGSRSRHIDPDVIEVLNEFRTSTAPGRAIEVHMTNIPDAPVAFGH